MSNLFSLLTAINTYHPGSRVPSLHGCHNDIRGWQSFLEAHFPKERRHSVALLDGDATYQNVVHHFGEAFLGRAQAGDTVLFVYSGHGSREGAAQEFDRYYPEGKQETLVLYDSRKTGGLDLADKELAVLIERIARKGAHVAVLLDCCHSGSATRNLEDFTLGAVRQHSDRGERRPLESYLDGAFTRQGAFYLPSSRHIAMAACDRTEKAWETTERQGLFSATLQSVLDATGGRLSYAELFSRCRAGMAKVTDKQHPQFEPYGLFNGYEGFLGLCEAATGAPLRVFFEKNTWQASMGAMHGLPVEEDKPAQFEVVQEGRVLGLMQSRVVGAERSSLQQPDFTLDPDRDYEARLRSIPVPKMAVQLSGAAAQIQAAYAALDAFQPRYFDLHDGISRAAYRMELGERDIRLIRNADGLRLRTIEGSNRNAMWQDAFQTWEHIAQWENNLALDNRSARIRRDEVELILVELDSEGRELRRTAEAEAVVDILRLGGVEKKAPFRIEVRNKSENHSRHCALFYASGNYGFLPLGFNEPVQQGNTVVAMERQPSGVPYTFQLNGKNESTDIFKLFVSNSPISGEALRQGPLKLGEIARHEQTRGDAATELSKTKDIGGFGLDTNAEPEDVNDWYCLTLRVKCVAREAAIGTQPVVLANGAIKVLPHPGFRAGLALESAIPGGRSAELMATVAELAAHAGVELMALAPPVRDAAPPNVLEIFDCEGEESLADNPLQIEIAAGLKNTADAEESLLSLTFDGEHLLPVGICERREDGSAIVRIDHLPDTEDVRRRSLGKALKLCFLKLVLKKEQVRLLRWVDYSRPKAERRSEGLPGKVHEAQRILLLLHGIIGDTQEMAESMRQAHAQGWADLVLTFDYENLNTPIEETAGYLEAQLREAGIHAGSGKKITILAHSMGGLVSRHFIENLGGKQVVQHLIMAGTPNAGSAIARIPTYRDYAIPLLTLLTNLPWGIPAAATVLSLLQGSKDLTVTLAQMDYDNAMYLKNLNKSADPGVPYSIIAGDLAQFFAEHPERRKLMDKALRLGGKVFYGDTPNDIAVSVESIKGVPPGRTPAPEVKEVACHHLNYFEQDGGLEVLQAVLTRGL